MTIAFRCEHCGKKVEAPDAVGGKRGKCPYCKQSCYIPAPLSDDDVLALADDADGPPSKEHEEIARQKSSLIRELAGGDSGTVPLDQRQDVASEDLQHYVVNYCLDMIDGKLERAETHVQALRKHRYVAGQTIDDFARGKLKEPALDRIPAKLLQGFLTQLRKLIAVGGGN